MTQTGNTFKGINHVGLSVSDVDRALAFYRSATTLDVVGRRAISDGPGPHRVDPPVAEPVDVAVVKGPNAYLELSQFEPSLRGSSGEVPVEGPGFTHVCFQSPAARSLYSRFTELGASTVSRGDGPVDLGGYGVLYGYARDDDGIMFEVEQLDTPPFEGPIWIAHVALVSHDIDRLADFYEDLLGIAPYRRVNKVTGPRADEVTGLDDVRMRAAWFDAGNMVLELWQYINPTTPEPNEPTAFESLGYNKFVFEVADLNAEYERLTAAGVEFLGTPIEVDGTREVFARDPDGNLFGLLQLPPDSKISLDRLKRVDWR